MSKTSNNGEITVAVSNGIKLERKELNLELVAAIAATIMHTKKSFKALRIVHKSKAWASAGRR